MPIQDDLLEIHKQNIEVAAFWMEQFPATIMHQILQNYTTEVIRNYNIIDMEIVKNKVLLKWVKRLHPLTNKELKEKYGR